MKWNRLLIAALIALALITSGYFYLESQGVHVTVMNHGPDPVMDILIHVTGNTHRIGDLEVGKSRIVTVRPMGESSVELDFVDPQGRRQRELVGGYIEPGYKGIINVEIEAGVVVRKVEKVTVY